jgi:hypothetical protein
MNAKYLIKVCDDMCYDKSLPIVIMKEKETKIYITNCIPPPEQKSSTIEVDTHSSDLVMIEVEIMYEKGHYMLCIAQKSSAFGLYGRLKPTAVYSLPLDSDFIIGRNTLKFTQKDGAVYAKTCSIEDQFEQSFLIKAGVDTYLGKEQIKDCFTSNKHLKLFYKEGDKKITIIDWGKVGKGSTAGVWFKKDVMKVDISNNLELMLNIGCYVKIEVPSYEPISVPVIIAPTIEEKKVPEEPKDKPQDDATLKIVHDSDKTNIICHISPKKK